MRALIWIIAVPIVVVLALVLLLPLLLDAETLIEIAAKQIKEQTGAELRVDGDASLSLFPKVGVSVSKVSVDVPDSSAQVRADSLAVGVAVLPLLSRTVEIEAINVAGMVVTQQAANEEAAKVAALDTSTLSPAELDVFYAARAQARQAAAADAAANVLAVPLALEVGKLALRDIRLVTVDSQQEPISELQLKEFTATDLNLAGRAIPLHAHVVVESEDEAPPIEIVIDGRALAALDDGNVTLDTVKINLVGATPDPVNLTINGLVDLKEQATDLNLELEVGAMSGMGKVRYASFESPQIDADLALTELNPALLVLAGPDAAAAGDMNEASTPAADQTPLPLHALRMIDTRAKLKIDTVVIEPHILTDVEATLRVVDGEVTLEPVQADVYGGKIDLKLGLDGRYNLAKLSAKGGVNGLDIGRAAAAMEIAVEASGAANLNWEVTGTGATVEALKASLTGPIDFTTAEVTLVGVQTQQMLCKAVALVNQESLTAEFPVNTEFQALEAKIRLADGIASLQPLDARLAAAIFSGNGTLDITSHDLRMSLRAQLNEELGEFDPACRINERYAELRWPVECRGNLADEPGSWCRINTREIVKDLAENELKKEAGKQAGKLLKKLFN
ncbi:MAG: AsmA family protein [Pseudomonadota bacterium]